MELSNIKLNQRFLYKRRGWESTIHEATLKEISPNKKNVRIMYSNGNDSWESSLEFEWWKIVDVFPELVRREERLED